MKKDVFWNSIGTALWSFSSLFLLIAVTRINGIEESGLFSFAFAFALIMFTVACYGGRTYQVSDHQGSFSINSYVSLRLFTSFMAIIVTVIFILTNGYDWYKSILILLLVGQRVFDAIADVFYGILQKKHHLYISGKSLFFKSLLSLIIFLAIDITTTNLLLATLSLPLVSLLFILFYDIPQSKKVDAFKIKPNLTELIKILKYTFLPFITIVMSLIFANLARYFIDINHPDLQGYFGIIIMPLSLILLMFSFVLTPALLRLSNSYNTKDFRSLNKMISKIIILITLGTIVLCILAYYISAPVLQLFFNVDFNDYVIDITYVIAIGLALSLTSLFTNMAVIARRLRPVAIILILSNLILALLCYLLIAEMQIRGAIIAYIVASIVQAIAMAIYYLYITRGYKFSKKS